MQRAQNIQVESMNQNKKYQSIVQNSGSNKVNPEHEKLNPITDVRANHTIAEHDKTNQSSLGMHLLKPGPYRAKDP